MQYFIQNKKKQKKTKNKQTKKQTNKLQLPEQNSFVIKTAPAISKINCQ